jgi:hypothetical protein
VSDYCAMTDWLNPMLERIDVWRKLESAIDWSPGFKFGQPRLVLLANRSDRESFTRETE